ncbi:MAG: hypothetical protein GDA54_00030 [Alphaproteobacteria bacterium GM7ARS4]|nr:hypothetical protein [Alphaproteobacteria bacterium GM7ARS4]
MIGTYIVSVIVSGALVAPAYAVEDLAEYDVIVGEGDSQPKARRGSGERDVLDYTIFDVGAYYTGGAVDRLFAGTEIGLDVPFNNNRGRIHLVGEFARSSIKLTQEREIRGGDARGECLDRNGADGVGGDVSFTDTQCGSVTAAALADALGFPATRELDVDVNDLDIADAYLQYALLNNVVVDVGRKRLVWGQFDLFSPVSILLPLKFQNNAVDFKKANFIMPQDRASLSWFATERLELQGHFFLSVKIDPLLESVIDEVDEDHDVEDHKQYAGRLLYRPDWGTLGFTFYRGRSGLFFYDNARLVNGEVERSVDLPPMTAYAVEMAIPTGNWVWKAEAVLQDTRDDVSAVPAFDATLGGDPPMYTGGFGGDGHLDYINYVLNQNGGSFTTEVQRLIAGIGFDTRLDRWLINFGVYLIQDSYDSKGDELRRLEEASGREASDDGFFFPSLNVVRFFGDQDRYRLGITGGFLGPILGVSVYGSMRFGDNLNLYGGGEFISTVADGYLNEANDEEGSNFIRYDLEDDIGIGFRFGARYSF